jgi:hypothetical protein
MSSRYKELKMTLSAANSTKMWPDENNVGINLVVTDNDRPDLGAGEQIVIEETISRQYVKGEDMTVDTATDIGNAAQALIDEYVAERVIYTKAIYQTRINQIVGALSL